MLIMRPGWTNLELPYVHRRISLRSYLPLFTLGHLAMYDRVLAMSVSP